VKNWGLRGIWSLKTRLQRKNREVVSSKELATWPYRHQKKKKGSPNEKRSYQKKRCGNGDGDQAGAEKALFWPKKRRSMLIAHESPVQKNTHLSETPSGPARLRRRGAGERCRGCPAGPIPMDPKKGERSAVRWGANRPHHRTSHPLRGLNRKSHHCRDLLNSARTGAWGLCYR